MKLLFCCESYWPNRGGVQEVSRQIADEWRRPGMTLPCRHQQEIPNRKTDSHNGVRIMNFVSAVIS